VEDRIQIDRVRRLIEGVLKYNLLCPKHSAIYKIKFDYSIRSVEQSTVVVGKEGENILFAPKRRGNRANNLVILLEIGIKIGNPLNEPKSSHSHYESISCAVIS